MSENKKILTEIAEGKEVAIDYPEAFKVVKFTSLLDRLEKEDPTLLPYILKLYDEMGKKDFANYINNLIKVKKHEDSLLIITKNNLQKSVIEGKFLDLIAKTFEVKNIRVFSNR